MLCSIYILINQKAFVYQKRKHYKICKLFVREQGLVNFKLIFSQYCVYLY